MWVNRESEVQTSPRQRETFGPGQYAPSDGSPGRRAAILSQAVCTSAVSFSLTDPGGGGLRLLPTFTVIVYL